MSYARRRESDGWHYSGLEIQADVETHRFVVEYATRRCPQGARVLDVGAGTGALAQQLLDVGLSVSGTSWDGKLRVPIPAYALDLDLPFSLADVGGEPFDLVCCIEVIEHVENPSALLRSLHAVVRRSGAVLLSTPNVESAQARLQWLIRGCPLIFHGNEVLRNRHISMMWRDGLEFLIERGGFDIESRHLLGPPRVRGAAQSVVKKPLYGLMRMLLSGDLEGETRLYALKPGDRMTTKAGPGEVY